MASILPVDPQGLQIFIQAVKFNDHRILVEKSAIKKLRQEEEDGKKQP